MTKEFTKPQGLRPIRSTLGKISGKVWHKRGFNKLRLPLKWEEIVGAVFSKYSYPEKITYLKNKNHKKPNGCLYIAASPSSALAFQHMSEEIIARVNNYLGSNEVCSIKLLPYNARVQLTEKDTENAHKIPLNHENMEKLTKTLSVIESVELKETLTQLAAALLTREEI